MLKKSTIQLVEKREEKLFHLADYFIQRSYETSLYMTHSKLQTLLYLSLKNFALVTKGQQLFTTNPHIFGRVLLFVDIYNEYGGIVEEKTVDEVEKYEPQIGIRLYDKDAFTSQELHFLNVFWNLFGLKQKDDLLERLYMDDAFLEAFANSETVLSFELIKKHTMSTI